MHLSVENPVIELGPDPMTGFFTIEPCSAEFGDVGAEGF